jgi:hypothetical protein
MSRWISIFLVLGVVFFFLGWGLVLTSRYRGNSSGGSELVWRVGGVMLYASVPTLLGAGVLRIVALLRSGGQRRDIREM